MRKIFGIILLILFIVFAFVYFNKKELKEEKDSSIDIEGYAKITNYYIYGNRGEAKKIDLPQDLVIWE